MSGSHITRVVVTAGGLGTRVASWAQYIPKEFYPVGGRPGIAHLLDEISALSPAKVAVVCHPYYEQFTAWARQVLGPDGHTRYDNAAGRALAAPVPDGLTLSFVSQRGPYADITSVINGADQLGSPGELYVVFGDNLYYDPGPLLALSTAAAGEAAVLARSYRAELAAQRGVIATAGPPDSQLMIDLAEKPGRQAADAMERRYGRRNLFLLEGRMRLTAAFTDFARNHNPPTFGEPKLALTLADYANSNPVHIIKTSDAVTDLGASPEVVSITRTETTTHGAGRSGPRHPAQYDPGMSERKTRVTVTLDPHLVEYAEHLVEDGRAPSVSAVLNSALTEQVENDKRIKRRWNELTAQADQASVSRTLAHIDAQVAQLPPEYR
jgi:UTP-glucose-1-phosphate uridylyltransferase/Arc/MetJ-type ribon-helix-helix transcriptional regulator